MKAIEEEHWHTVGRPPFRVGGAPPVRRESLSCQSPSLVPGVDVDVDAPSCGRWRRTSFQALGPAAPGTFKQGVVNGQVVIRSVFRNPNTHMGCYSSGMSGTSLKNSPSERSMWVTAASSAASGSPDAIASTIAPCVIMRSIVSLLACADASTVCINWI